TGASPSAQAATHSHNPSGNDQNRQKTQSQLDGDPLRTNLPWGLIEQPPEFQFLHFPDGV
ncbi:MAG: hypothetical protein ACLQVG_11855, partial [Terriglobia bacterium]